MQALLLPGASRPPAAIPSSGGRWPTGKVGGSVARPPRAAGVRFCYRVRPEPCSSLITMPCGASVTQQSQMPRYRWHLWVLNGLTAHSGRAKIPPFRTRLSWFGPLIFPGAASRCRTSCAQGEMVEPPGTAPGSAVHTCTASFIAISGRSRHSQYRRAGWDWKPRPARWDQPRPAIFR